MKLKAAIAAEIKQALFDLEVTPLLVEQARSGEISRPQLVQFLRDALGGALDQAYVDFALRNGGVPSLQQVSTAAQERLFGEMADSTLDLVQDVAGRGQDWSQERLARELRRAVRLTGKDAKAVKTYDTELKTGNRKALRRALRDRRSDPTLKAGRELTVVRRRALVKKYEDRLIRHRASMVARSATRAAQEATLFAHWTDRAEAGDEEALKVRKFWGTMGDEKVRDSHSHIPDDYPDGLPLNEAFVTRWGTIRHPHDPQAHPKDKDGCRCRMRIGLPPKK